MDSQSHTVGVSTTTSKFIWFENINELQIELIWYILRLSSGTLKKVGMKTKKYEFVGVSE